MAISQIHFGSPTDVVAFVKACLQTSDIDRLYDAACEKTNEFWRQKMFEDLHEIEQEESLAEVFVRDNEFPTNQLAYTMGGHSNRTRHIHFDLMNVDGLWRLQKIWKCR